MPSGNLHEKMISSNKVFIISLSILIVSLSIACKQSDSKGSADEQAITIDTFSDFPPEIDGCACYFSNDSIDFKKEEYIYMNDYAQLSFLKINGELIKFTQTEYNKIDSLTTSEKFSSDEYEMTIHTRSGEQSGEETSIYRGTIELTDKRGKTISRNFYGECGC